MRINILTVIMYELKEDEYVEVTVRVKVPEMPDTEKRVQEIANGEYSTIVAEGEVVEAKLVRDGDIIFESN